MRCTSSVASTARRFSSLSALLLTLLVASCSDGPAPLVVPTTEGDVQGTLAEDLRIFLGIPYAAPPTGALRFLPPAAPAARTETLVAEQYGPSCPGTRTPLDLVLRPRPAAEDCLSLNIWTQRAAGRRPVMFFIHGGGYVNGASNIPVYDGASLARNGDVVVVSINYRLAALGFLSTEALQAERASMDGGAGNMGILDMLAALRWVQDNIAAFGGDPENVTIFGESAGGAAVCALLAAPGAEGLFHRGIIESGGCDASPLRGGSRGTFDIGDTLVARLGCEGAGELACLRALTTQQILAAVMEDASGLGFAPYGPAIDGVTFAQSPGQLLAAGEGVDVPLMVGSNRDEMTVFLLGTPRPGTPAEMRAEFLSAAGDDEAKADALMELYGVTTDEDAPRAFVAFATDRAFACDALSIAETAASVGREVYLYEFQHVVGNQGDTFGVGPRLRAALRVRHARPLLSLLGDARRARRPHAGARADRLELVRARRRPGVRGRLAALHHRDPRVHGHRRPLVGGRRVPPGPLRRARGAGLRVGGALTP
ncbi:MAG: carboxylesterase family protein [Sandaracinaceae bacterium]|nr:carboxylesterase family protein [Sandaracinaceae bacterium]